MKKRHINTYKTITKNKSCHLITSITFKDSFVPRSKHTSSPIWTPMCLYRTVKYYCCCKNHQKNTIFCVYLCLTILGRCSPGPSTLKLQSVRDRDRGFRKEKVAWQTWSTCRFPWTYNKNLFKRKQYLNYFDTTTMHSLLLEFDQRLHDYIKHNNYE